MLMYCYDWNNIYKFTIISWVENFKCMTSIKELSDAYSIVHMIIKDYVLL